MQLDAVVGNAQVVQDLKAALQMGALAHAVLLCAPDGCGRNFAGRCLAADYLFPGGGAGAAAVMRGEGAEVLTAKGEGRSGQIPVERIRAIRADIFRSALSAAGRVVHICDAHRMAAPAANALLKVLEEPPADVLFILSAAAPALVPVTLQSRCAVYTLAPVPLADCEALLQKALPPGVDAQLPAILAALYGGRCGLALAALQNEERLEVVRGALRAAKAALQGDAYSLAAQLAAYEGRGEGDREKRSALLADMACALDAQLNGRQLAGLPPADPAKAARLLPPVLDAAAALGRNAAPKITFTALAVRLGRAVV